MEKRRGKTQWPEHWGLGGKIPEDASVGVPCPVDRAELRLPCRLWKRI